ncbi:MAG TPA: hypothetical protein VI455_02410 [Terriglobia bacterium]
MSRSSTRRQELARRARKGFRGYPVATIAYYGPDNTRASKAAVGIVLSENAEPLMERFFAEEDDVRYDSFIQEQILDLIKTHGVRSVVSSGGLIGCPHEEGVDYPEGKSCPMCPYWAGRDRFTGERIQ